MFTDVLHKSGQQCGPWPVVYSIYRAVEAQSHLHRFARHGPLPPRSNSIRNTSNSYRTDSEPALPVEYIDCGHAQVSLPPKVPLPLGDPGPHKAPSKWHLYQFSRFCTVQCCAKQTDRQRDRLTDHDAAKNTTKKPLLPIIHGIEFSTVTSTTPTMTTAVAFHSDDSANIYRVFIDTSKNF